MDVRWGLGLLCLALAGGCDGHEPAFDASARIANGLLAEDAPHTATVAVHERGTSGAWRSLHCSGTLIGPRAVVTAAHCVVFPGGTLADGSVGISLLLDGNEAQQSDVIAADIHVHPGYEDGAVLSPFDLAVLSLHSTPLLAEDDPFDSDIAVARLGELDEDDIFVGAELVGYGMNTFAGFDALQPGQAGPARPAPPDVGVRMYTGTEIWGLSCPADVGCDDPSDRSYRAWYLSNDDFGGHCAGDSGGALFVYRDAAGNPVSPQAPGARPFLGGVISGRYFRTELCNGIGTSIRVDTHRDFLARFVADFNGDAHVDRLDVPGMINAWDTQDLRLADFNGDLAVNALDLLFMLQLYEG